MNRKLTLFFALFLVFAQTAWTQSIQQENTNVPIKFHQNVEVFARFNTLQDYEPSLFSASAMYNIWGKRFSASGGTQIQEGDTQLTLSASYAFFQNKKLSLGTGIIYNLNWLHDYSITNNFLPCFFLEWQPNSVYKLKLSIDLLFKFRHLFIFRFNQHQLINSTVAIQIKSIFNLPKNFLLYVEFASIETFRYAIFCAPSYIAGVEYKLNDSFDIMLDATVHYIDFFTLSAHYADTDIRIGGRFKW